MTILISIIAIVTTILILTKFIEIGLDLRWVIKHGKYFANDLLKYIPEVSNDEDWQTKWTKLEKKHKRSYFLLSKLIKEFIKKSEYRFVRKLLNIIKCYIFRGVFLVIFQSLIVPIIILFNRQNGFYSVYLYVVIIILVSGLILTTIFLLFNNLKLGFINNFQLSILSQLDKYDRPEFRLSVRDLLTRFLIIFGRNLISIIIGFAGIYTALYYINKLIYFKGISTSCPILVWFEFIYYSVVTLTTTGYGDINSIHWISRITSSLELIVSLTFITILVLSFQVTYFHKKVTP